MGGPVLLKAPFPYFGGKSRVAPLVWERFGDVPNYVECFAGSLAVLLHRPHDPRTETINDLDCMVANFWRALQADPEAVTAAADRPVNEADQHAIHLWLCTREAFREHMKTDPEYFDPLIAGRWVYGQCVWIGSGWCAKQLPESALGAPNDLWKQTPHLGNDGTGIHRKLPHLGDAGRGVNRQLPHLGEAGNGIHRKRPHLGGQGNAGGKGIHRRDTRDGGNALMDYMSALADRLRRVRVCCGDWSRITGPSVTFKHGLTGVFLDPPYADTAGRDGELYAHDDLNVAHDVRKWAIENGDKPLLRIALCGYEGEHEMPDTWECVAWKAPGGYGSQGEGSGRENCGRERIWFSPACIRPDDRAPSLFDGMDAGVAE